MFKLLQRILAAPVLWETRECKSSILFIAAAPGVFVPGSSGNVPGALGRGPQARRGAPKFVIPPLLCFLSGRFLRESSLGKVRNSWGISRLSFCWELSTSLGSLFPPHGSGIAAGFPWNTRAVTTAPSCCSRLCEQINPGFFPGRNWCHEGSPS